MIDLVRNYSIRHDRKIKKICEPLHHLGFSIFTYYSIDEEGTFTTLSSYPEQLDYYHSEKLYLTEPYLGCPENFCSGYEIIPAARDEAHQSHCRQRYQVDQALLKLERRGKTLEGFFFSSKRLNAKHNFFQHIELLNQFSFYFKREAGGLLEQMREDRFNLKEAKGKAFYDRHPDLTLSSKNPHTNAFIKSVSPLSERERDCLDLFKKGHSAQATASILGISQRTVESYFQNIKNKLGCESKWDLLNC